MNRPYLGKTVDQIVGDIGWRIITLSPPIRADVVKSLLKRLENLSGPPDEDDDDDDEYEDEDEVSVTKVSHEMHWSQAIKDSVRNLESDTTAR